MIADLNMIYRTISDYKSKTARVEELYVHLSLHYLLMLLSNLLALITFVHFIQTLSIKCLVSNVVFWLVE